MSVIDDSESIRDAYNEVKDDNSELNWVVLKYEDKKIVLESTGSEYEEFVSKFTDDERAYGFVRVFTGNEMDRTSKFALITWIGPTVPPLKKARVSTDKPFVKEIIQSFTLEILASELSEIKEQRVRTALE